MESILVEQDLARARKLAAVTDTYRQALSRRRASYPPARPRMVRRALTVASRRQAEAAEKMAPGRACSSGGGHVVKDKAPKLVIAAAGRTTL